MRGNGALRKIPEGGGETEVVKTREMKEGIVRKGKLILGKKVPRGVGEAKKLLSCKRTLFLLGFRFRL